MDCSCLVSIIVPVFNVRPYLEEALDSVVQQTYENLEIIVVDDGSTEGSGDICEEYAKRDRRIVLIHQYNKGLSDARNVGLDQMHGEAVAFLDSDDVYHRDFVKEMMTTMIREEADIVVSRYIHLSKLEEATQPIPQSRKAPSIKQGRYNRAEALRALVKDEINVSVWNKLYRSTLWESLRFPSGHVYEDVYSSYQVFDRSTTTYVVNKTLYYYRKRAGRITATLTWKNVEDRMEAGMRFGSFVESNVPSIFSEEQLRCWRQSELFVLIQQYLRVMRGTAKDRKTIGAWLRKEIIKRGALWDITGYKLQIRIAYKMMCYSPGVLMHTYSVYRLVRAIKRKVKKFK